MEARQHLAQRPPHLAQRHALQVPRRAPRQGHHLARVAQAQARGGLLRVRATRRRRAQHRAQGRPAHLVPERTIHLQERAQERVGSGERAVPVRLLRRLHLQPRQHGGAERPPRAPRFRGNAQRAPPRDVLRARASQTRQEQPRCRLSHRDGARAYVRRARGERLEARLAGEHAPQPGGFSVRVSLVDVRLPDPGGDVSRERGEVLRRERRVAVAEGVEPRRLAVREPAAERRLDGVRRPDAPREGELRRRDGLASAAQSQQSGVQLDVPAAALDVLRGAQLQRAPVRRRELAPGKERSRR